MNENLQQAYQAISDVLSRTKDVNDQMLLHLGLHLIQTEMATAGPVEIEAAGEVFEQLAEARS